MKTFKYILVLTTSLVFNGLFAQQQLTVKDAITIAIESNYDVRIAKNDTKVSDIENHLLNSEYLPTISASAGVNYSDEAQNVVFADGSNTKVDNAITESYNASITAEYIIFDGLERKFNVKKNAENLNYKKLEERQAIENTIVSVYQQYYDLAYKEQLVNNYKLNIENSLDRLERAKKKLKYGQGTKLDELNAQVDLNTDSISYASSVRDFKNSQRNLNLLLGREITKTFKIDTTVVFMDNISEDDIIKSTLKNNITALLNEQDVLLSELDIKINRAKFLPKVSGSTSYQWNESVNPVTSFALQNEVSGINLGLNLSWNLFDGGRTKTKIRTARVENENREIRLYRAKEELKTGAYNSYEDYINKKFTLKAESNNVETNRLNFSKTQKQFSLGQITAIEYREAQINLFNALNNYAKSKYDLKIAEIILLQLAGTLIQ